MTTIDDVTHVAPSVDGPVVSAATDYDSIVERLQRRFPAVPAVRIRATVDDAGDRMAHSRIPHYLPVLIERIARNELTREESGR